ncbi:MAG TPA: sensor domain-containing diguanylate cyclase [Gaiellaceae bacterium]|nr:sensor domain-containing diguanylate cyclase [Gaiellaceae bacterium]
MDPVVTGLAAALAVSLIVLFDLSSRVRRRVSRQADSRVEGAVGSLEQRMAELARELEETIRRTEEETRRSRFMSQIGSTVDLDDVLETALQAASALPHADAALVRLERGADDEPVVASRGFDDDAPDAGALFGQPDAWGARAVELSYRYADSPAANGTIRAALGVPLLDRSGRIGWLGVFSRSPQGRFGDEELHRLEELAERVAPALENARRFQEASRLADLDSLTGLHNRRFFHETLAREVARAHRYGRRLSLVLMDVDDFKEINDRIGHLAGDAALAEAAERVRLAVRAADIACRVGGDELGVILPESGLEDAQRLVARIQESIASRPVGRAGRVRISAGAAELQTDDDATRLFERADEVLYAAKHSRKSGPGLAAAD